MNNFEKIKQMNIDEMTDFIRDADCRCCEYSDDKGVCKIDTEDFIEADCSYGIRLWLRSKAK